MDGLPGGGICDNADHTVWIAENKVC